MRRWRCGLMTSACSWLNAVRDLTRHWQDSGQLKQKTSLTRRSCAQQAPVPACCTWCSSTIPVRRFAAVHRCSIPLPKNLDIYVTDMPQRIDALKAAGRTFRNENFSEVTAPNGITFREIHMPGHDLINIVLLEILGGDMVVPGPALCRRRAADRDC